MGITNHVVHLETVQENLGSGRYLNYLRQRGTRHHICALPALLHDCDVTETLGFKK